MEELNDHGDAEHGIARQMPRPEPAEGFPIISPSRLMVRWRRVVPSYAESSVESSAAARRDSWGSPLKHQHAADQPPPRTGEVRIVCQHECTQGRSHRSHLRSVFRTAQTAGKTSCRMPRAKPRNMVRLCAAVVKMGSQAGYVSRHANRSSDLIVRASTVASRQATNLRAARRMNGQCDRPRSMACDRVREQQPSTAAEMSHSPRCCA